MVLTQLDEIFVVPMLGLDEIFAFIFFCLLKLLPTY